MREDLRVIFGWNFVEGVKGKQGHSISGNGNSSYVPVDIFALKVFHRAGKQHMNEEHCGVSRPEAKLIHSCILYCIKWN